MDEEFVAGEGGGGFGRDEGGLLGEEDAHVVEDVGGGGDQLRALLDEAVRANGGGVVDATGDGVDRAALLAGLGGADEGAALRTRLDDEDAERAAGDDAVAHGEGLAVGLRAHGELGDDGARGGNFFGEGLVFRRVELEEAAAEDGDGAALRGEGGLVGGGVDAPGEAADNRNAGVGELVGEFFRGVRSVMTGLARADDADGMAVAFEDFAKDVKGGWWIVDFAEEGRVVRRGWGEDFGAGIVHEGEFGGEVDGRLPGAEGFGGLWTDTFDGLELRQRRGEDGRGRAEGIEEAPDANGADARHHVEGDVGLGVGHGRASKAAGGRPPKENIGRKASC